MKVKQVVLTALNITPESILQLQDIQPQLILVFASMAHFNANFFSNTLLNSMPHAQWLGCSTAGEISASGVTDNTAIFTAIHFEHPDFKIAIAPLINMKQTAIAGQTLGKALNHIDLKNILVFGQGVDINGSALIDGIKAIVNDKVIISGGLAGDAGRFTRTFTLSNDGISDQSIVAIGFYGEHIQLSVGYFGGWQAFGSARQVSRYDNNILYELDGKPALDLYKNYLGDYAKELPASGLLFPFSMMTPERKTMGIIRTLLGINESEGSLTLAGDVIENGYLQLMLASTEALVSGAETAANLIKNEKELDTTGLAILISGVGRKLLMGGRVDEEVEAVGEVFGAELLLAGFYANGEIGPYLNTSDSKLHNQTMTITYLSEK
ncbi:MAG: FIST N-terminal domain-containing protein [Agitococcus sp.]|nr:FIST N-terminal domain-containing protein [Agitococcus sp.]MDO9180037.1 FIST N-terminal domain-containing protein [Agitococcus sp.]